MKNINPSPVISRHLPLSVFPVLLAIFWLSCVNAAPSPDLWPRWQEQASDSTTTVDHRSWDLVLKKYLVTDHPSGINLFRYGDVSQEDEKKLTEYLEYLQQVEVSSLNRKEQFAYWINLYNALTIQVILDHYPVKSIMDIDISPGFFSNGPWDAKLLTIKGEKVSLNDIEHRILRPIFKDNRIHYAVNCASIGCPNLQPVAFTAANTEELLQAGAKAYVNSPRGARMVNGKLIVSSIYKWFRVDFGGSEESVVQHLRQYAEEDLDESLRTYSKGLLDDYDWNLNEP
ncbi:MAG: DUF547 domain-containing protein [Desulfobacterales bacterium]|nr:DUF547 domain-containing protein [Desulfobacterales bacterium]